MEEELVVEEEAAEVEVEAAVVVVVGEEDRHSSKFPFLFLSSLGQVLLDHYSIRPIALSVVEIREFRTLFQYRLARKLFVTGQLSLESWFYISRSMLLTKRDTIYILCCLLLHREVEKSGEFGGTESEVGSEIDLRTSVKHAGLAPLEGGQPHKPPSTDETITLR